MVWPHGEELNSCCIFQCDLANGYPQILVVFRDLLLWWRLSRLLPVWFLLQLSSVSSFLLSQWWHHEILSLQFPISPVVWTRFDNNNISLMHTHKHNKSHITHIFLYCCWVRKTYIVLHIFKNSSIFISQWK